MNVSEDKDAAQPALSTSPLLKCTGPLPRPKLLLFAINITTNKGKLFHCQFWGVVWGFFFYHKRDQIGESGLPVHTSLCLWKASPA